MRVHDLPNQEDVIYFRQSSAANSLLSSTSSVAEDNLSYILRNSILIKEASIYISPPLVPQPQETSEPH